MTYALLGQDLHEVADASKKWFASQYGATGFVCEQEVMPDLPLKPTWQARMKTGYTLCLNVQPTPFSPTLHEFVNKCAARGLPIKLWVAVGSPQTKDTFGSDLKQARNLGIGVLQIIPGVDPHEFHRAVPLSLFALGKTAPAKVPAARREAIKNAEDTFLDGAPDQGCQAICQELELLTRQFAQLTYASGWWRTPANSKALRARFFTTDSWSTMLETMEARLDVKKVAGKSPQFTKQAVVRARSFTDWRNSVSHKPKTVSELRTRDARLRTMFEATRDLLIDWYVIAKPLGLLA